jgi:hypothetical protein
MTAIDGDRGTRKHVVQRADGTTHWIDSLEPTAARSAMIPPAHGARHRRHITTTTKRTAFPNVRRNRTHVAAWIPPSAPTLSPPKPRIAPVHVPQRAYLRRRANERTQRFHGPTCRAGCSAGCGRGGQGATARAQGMGQVIAVSSSCGAFGGAWMSCRCDAWPWSCGCVHGKAAGALWWRLHSDAARLAWLRVLVASPRERNGGVACPRTSSPHPCAVGTATPQRRPRATQWSLRS